jgi:hypothetical protein
MSSSPPLVVADRYRLVAPLGQGGMGRVWRATDVVLHRDVAIKELVPPPGLTPGERQEMRERSLREARAIARLNNINVVRVFDVLRTDADPWIVMEYVESRSLQDTLASDGPFGPVRAAEIGLGVLGALRAAHRAGVVHRDVKPGNVLIGADGRVVLTDFGLATVPGDPNVTRTGLVLGSPAYIAPERARDGTAGPGADLWSLGATLYAAVEGASPFARPSAIATLAALATENPPPARNAGPLKPVLNGLLRKDPAHRINAEETERLLLRAAGRRSKLTFPMSPTMRRPGVGRERPALPGGPGSLAAAGGAPVVPGPRPPAAPARPANPPAQTGKDRPPVYVPGKASVGTPGEDTPARPDGSKIDATRLDATRVDTPAIKDDKTRIFGTRRGAPTAPGQSTAAPAVQLDAVPDDGLTRTRSGEQDSFTAVDLPAHGRAPALPDHEKPPAEPPALLHQPAPDVPTDGSDALLAGPAFEPSAPGGSAPTEGAPGPRGADSEATPAAVASPEAEAGAASSLRAAPGSTPAEVQTGSTADGVTLVEATASAPDVATSTKAAQSTKAGVVPTSTDSPTPSAVVAAPPEEAIPGDTAAAAPAQSTSTKAGKSARTRRQSPTHTPEAQPATPETQPATPEARSAAPEVEPVVPDAEPATLTAEPAEPVDGTENAAAEVPAQRSTAIAETEVPTEPPPGNVNRLNHLALPLPRAKASRQKSSSSTPVATEPEADDNAPVSPIPGLGRPARPAWRPMDERPSHPGVTLFGTRLTYRQAGIGAVVLLLVLILLITLVAQALGDKDKDKDSAGGKPGAVPTAAANTTAPQSPAPSVTPSASTPPSTTPSSAPTSAAATPGSITLPPGWKWYRGKASGHYPAFTVPVPNKASVSQAAQGEMHFQWDNHLLIVGRTDDPEPNVLDDWRIQEKKRKSTYDNYHLIKLAYVSYPGFKRAADWEFTYTTDTGNDQHAVKRNISVSAKAAYSLSWYTTPSDWSAAQSQLKLIYQGFQPK